MGLIASITTIFLMLPETYLTFLPNGITTIHLFYLGAMLMLVMTVLSKNEFTFDDAGVFMLASLYVGRGFHYFLMTADMGFFTVMFVLFIVWSTDIGAYLLGMKFGKTKLAPVISPNKSIEGAVGGVATAVVVSLIYVTFYNQMNLSILLLVFLTILLSVVGQLGDLTESAFKRYFGVKDSGKILPGHGGILDRFDSLLFVMPLFQIFLSIYQLN
ncbi:phosphatidate cytidylyltransferase [Jeotgalibaca sp. MA1X17-3]|uniref:phosphatidate cytidylyltransferase n=1 Tax=Jeotgalibaca sp. MA1X17-3 TaxID=2908211 RepID=UPI0028834C18|nr:phosphatidate cytidylyltransferase [Jeotgalibaca sp. MA1X17-3]